MPHIKGKGTLFLSIKVCGGCLTSKLDSFGSRETMTLVENRANPVDLRALPES